MKQNSANSLRALSACSIVASSIVTPSLLSASNDAVQIQVIPTITRQIGGIAELDRKVYFAVADSGENLDKKVSTPEIYDYLTNELNVRFGRQLGPIQAVVKWNDWTREDPDRPGFADIEYLDSKLKARQPSAQMITDYGPNLDVASHGHQGAYPAFMGEFTTEEASDYHHPQVLPTNYEAAAELALHVFQYNYSDLSRPRYFEPINEPHWSFSQSDVLSDWHLKMHEVFQEELPEVLVGGPCMSVAYMFESDYRAFNSMRDFIDKTEGKMDFYSFHAYDYINYTGDEFEGRIQTGLPMEGVLDLIPNYTMNQYSKETPIVISEHGGYATGKAGKTPEDVANEIAAEYFPDDEEGFELELKKASVLSHQHVRSILTNTLSFMDHPHTLKKAVPFILLETMAWDPKYYATFYAPYNFEDKDNWVETANSDFYKLFKDLKGRRVAVINQDQDLQVQAFADSSTLQVVVNNLYGVDTPLALNVPEAESYSIRRYGRNVDFTPFLSESEVESLDDLVIKGFEAIIITANYEAAIDENLVVNERAYYGDRTTVKVAADTSEDFKVEVADLKGLKYGSLRIAHRRPLETDREIKVLLNGNEVLMPIEDGADRFEAQNDYATTRIALIHPSWIKEDNVVTVSFPDGNPGTVGSVVLRAAASVN
ncbi:MAG: beta-agarase [Opitutaceae bacterium]